MKKRTKKTISVAVKVFTRLLLATILCAVLWLSMEVITFAIFKQEVGYQIFDRANMNAKPIEHYYSSGEVIQTADSLNINPETQYFKQILEVPAGAKTVMGVISQILLFIIFCIFPYHILWEFGNRDDTNVRYRGQRPDPKRGFKIGLLAMIPTAACWLILVVSKFVPILANFFAFYRVINIPYWYYNDFVCGGATSIAYIELWQLLLLLPAFLLVPLTCAIAYRMGGNQFSISEFLTFAKKKQPSAEEDDEI